MTLLLANCTDWVKPQWGRIGAGEVDLTGYATETYVQDAIDDIVFPETDLTGYATEAYVAGYAMPLDLSTLPPMP